MSISFIDYEQAYQQTLNDKPKKEIQNLRVERIGIPYSRVTYLSQQTLHGQIQYQYMFIHYMQQNLERYGSHGYHGSWCMLVLLVLVLLLLLLLVLLLLLLL